MEKYPELFEKAIELEAVEQRWVHNEENMTFAELDLEEILDFINETPSDYELQKPLSNKEMRE